MRVDTNTKGHRQWYYFSIKNSNKQMIKLNIFRFKKQYSLYQRGMRPYVKSRKSGYDWGPGGQNVKYCVQKRGNLQQSNKMHQQNEQNLSYYLSFTYKFEHQNDQVFFAAGIPYTYTFLQSRLSNFQQIAKDKHQNVNFQVCKLTKTTCGLPLPLIIIQRKIKTVHAYKNSNIDKNQDRNQQLKQTNATVSNREQTQRQLKQQSKQNRKKETKKRIIIINARSHSGQSSGSWVLDGLLQELTKSKAAADWIVQNNICIKIVPMLNPDGVFMGNYRTGIVGDDFNRKFMSGKKQYFPEIFGLKKLIAESKKQGSVELFLDLHGHSVLKNSFIFGPIDQMFKNCALKSLPQKLNETTKYFRMANCKFRMEKDLIQTARIFFQVKQSVLSYTCENSLGLYYSQMQTFQFLKADYQSFGASILLNFMQLLTEKNPIVQNPHELLPQMNPIHTPKGKIKNCNSVAQKFNHSKNLQSSKQMTRKSTGAKKISQSQKRNRKSREKSQKRNPTQTQQNQRRQNQRKQKASTELSKKQKVNKISDKLPNISKDFAEKQKQHASKSRKSSKSIKNKDEVLNDIIQTKKQQYMKSQYRSIKMGMFQIQQKPKRQFSNTRITMKNNYKKKNEIYNALPQNLKNKIGLKPLKNQLEISTKIYDQINFQPIRRSITDDNSYLNKLIGQMKQFDEGSSNEQLGVIDQNFSQNYQSINDLDSESEDLSVNQKKYILDHIQASRLNRRKSQQIQNESQQQSEEKEEQEHLIRQNSLLVPNINRFKEIKFKSIQPPNELTQINKTTFSMGKQNNPKKQKDYNKFKDSLKSAFQSAHQGIEQQSQQQFVNMVHKKKISERPMFKTVIKQPYLLIKLKASLPQRNKINFSEHDSKIQ